MSKKYTVYLATNIATGEQYVGCTSVGLEKRRRAHWSKASAPNQKRQKFQEAIARYGRDSFVWEVLSVHPTEAEGFSEELRMIAELRPVYNVTIGGKGTRGIASHNRRAVTCLEDGKMFPSIKHAESYYGIDLVTISDACRGKNRHAHGKHFIFGDMEYSERERAVLIRKIEMTHAARRYRGGLPDSFGSAASGTDSLGRSTNGPKKNSRAVICVDTGERFPSASDASRAFNIQKSAIIELCLGKRNRKSVGGYVFKYEDAA